jgi:L-ascorbate metabolism protein UlaG (beta-lactamase superfamily)
VTTRLRFLGASGYEVIGPRSRILFDPLLRSNPWAPTTVETIERPDLICVSHGAWDHLGDAAAIAQRTGAPIITTADVARKLVAEGLPVEQVRATIWGVCYDINGVLVRPVECHHWTASEMPDGSVVAGTPLSFIVETEPGVRIYHFGDTALFSDMKLIGELYKPSVGLLGCAQTDGLPDDPGAGTLVSGEMTPDEAALAAEWLGVRYALATHYMHPGPESAEFVRRVAARDTTGQRIALAPAIGEVIEVEPVPGDYPHLVWGRTSETWDPAYRPAMAPQEPAPEGGSR